jgi:hypothetical protein
LETANCIFGQEIHNADAHWGFSFGYAWACEEHAKEHGGMMPTNWGAN